MPEQLNIFFPKFPPGIFEAVRKEYVKQEEDKKDQLIKNLKNTIRAFKGHTTKRKKKKS